MGRASRIKRESVESRRQMADQRQKEATAKKKVETRKKILGWCAGILAILLIASVLGYNRFVNSGYMMRNTVSVSTENYKVDNTILSYFFFTQYQGFMSRYGDYATYFGLDTSKSLKTQVCSMTGDGSSWFTYFMNNALSELETVLLYCEEANARGITLDDEDYANIEESINLIKAEAKSQGMSASTFIKSLYGRGVAENDVRRALELTSLYVKCYNVLAEEFTYGEADYDNYVKENPHNLLRVSYSTVALGINEKTGVTADVLADFKARLEAAENRADFDGILFDYLKNYAYKDSTEEMTDSAIREEIAGYESTNVKYSDTDFMKWAVASDRQVDDVYVVTDEKGESVNAYILTATAELPQYDSVNVRHILLTAATYGTLDAAKAKAEALLTEWKEGAATAESFGELAAENSEDSAENGLYTDVLKDTMVETFNDWIFAEDRKIGDTGIIESDYGIHVMYMEGYGQTAWKVDADAALKTDAFEAARKSMEENYKINVDSIGLALLDV